VAAGAKLAVKASVPSSAAGAARVLRLRVTDPQGKLDEDYSRNLILRGEPATLRLPFALSDSPGEWRLTLTDRVSGESAARTVRVEPPPAP
jgi:hypothetical protein